MSAVAQSVPFRVSVLDLRPEPDAQPRTLHIAHSEAHTHVAAISCGERNDGRTDASADRRTLGVMLEEPGVSEPGGALLKIPRGVPTCSFSSNLTSYRLLLSARSMGDRRHLSRSVWSAPLSSNTFTVSRWPFSAA